MGAVTSNDKLTAEGALDLNRKLLEVQESLKQKFKYSQINYSDLAPDVEVFRQYQGRRFETHILANVSKGGKPYVLHTLLPNFNDFERHKNVFLSYIEIIEQVQPYVTNTYLPMMKGWTIVKYDVDGHDIYLPAIVYDSFDISASVRTKLNAGPMISCQDAYRHAIKMFQTLAVTRKMKAGCHLSRHTSFFSLDGKSLVMLPSKPCNQGSNKCDQAYYDEKSQEAIAEINDLTFLLIKMMVGPKAEDLISNLKSGDRDRSKSELFKVVEELCQLLLEPLLQTDISNIYTPEAYLEYLRSKPVQEMFAKVSGIEQTPEDAQKIAQDLALIQSANQIAYREYCSSREPLKEVIRSVLKCLEAADKTLTTAEKVELVKQMILESKVKFFAVCYKDRELEQEISNLANQE